MNIKKMRNLETEIFKTINNLNLFYEKKYSQEKQILGYEQTISLLKAVILLHMKQIPHCIRS